jgi:hypothetical protein
MMEKSSALHTALAAMEKLTATEKLQLAEAIGETLPDIWPEWIEKKADELYESDEEDIRLAEEALAEYNANPASAVPWDEFYQQQLNHLKESKAYADH